MHDGAGASFDKTYGSHSGRKAVISALKLLNVPDTDIAAHVSCSVANLPNCSKHIEEDGRWHRPLQCLEAHEFLVAKLVIPFVHHTTSADGVCGCRSLLFSSKSSSEENGAERELRLASPSERSPQGEANDGEAL